MDAEVEKMHLQSIEEYVLDEEKIVTYRWLSKVLSIHVNLSKELLLKFSSDPSNESNVYLTYLISGKLKDGTHSFLVVGQDEFDEAKSGFEFITSHHIYSVQKKKETPSANLLYMVNSEKVENEIDVSNKIGVIKCALSIQRAEDEMSSLRLKSLLKNVPSESNVSAKKATTSSDSVKKEVEKKDDKETKDKTPENKPKRASGGIAAMFAAQSSKSSSVASSSSKSKAKPPAKKTDGINSFFSKVPKIEDSPKKKVQEKSNEKEQSDEPMDVDDSTKDTDKVKSAVEEEKSEDISAVKEAKPDKISPPKLDKPKEQETTTMKTNGKTPKNKPKRKSKSKSTSKPEKARKRIKVIDSDSSDDMFASEKEDSPEPVGRNSPSLPPSPPPARKIVDSDDEMIPPTPQPESDKKNRRKRRVVKDKSYMDEDGFIVTEKVTVYESCSESESDNKDNAKKPKEEESRSKAVKADERTSKATKEDKPANGNKDNKKPAKKTASPLKNKQASLMSFFKKV